MKKIKITLKDGSVVFGDKFDANDYNMVKEIFDEWLKINEKVKSLGGRAINVPDVFSEAIFCYFFNSARTNRTAYSYDCVEINSGIGIQVKSASIANDCTSFGPTSSWDELYFMDFAPSGTVDGTVNIYKCDFSLNEIILNKKKKETFRDQQLQGRRPRLSLKALLQEKNIKPIKTINLLD